MGFRQYLVTAEANQIRWEEAQDVFSRYLPFAIVFGVADRWAKTFQEVAAAAAAAGQVVIMPDWYIYHGALFPDFEHRRRGRLALDDRQRDVPVDARLVRRVRVRQFGRVVLRWRGRRSPSARGEPEDLTRRRRARPAEASISGALGAGG